MRPSDDVRGAWCDLILTVGADVALGGVFRSHLAHYPTSVRLFGRGIEPVHA